MDSVTFDYYSRNADFCASRWEALDRSSGVAAHFATAFEGGPTLLDIGCGSGRHLAGLLALGHDVWGVEPCSELAAVATTRHRELADRIALGSLPSALDLPSEFPETFDGVLCAAMLMHLPKGELPEAFDSIRGLLRPGGRVLISIPHDRPNISDQRDPAGRYFSEVTSNELERLGERVGFQSMGLWQRVEDGQARPGHTWDVLLLGLAD